MSDATASFPTETFIDQLAEQGKHHAAIRWLSDPELLGLFLHAHPGNPSKAPFDPVQLQRWSERLAAAWTDYPD